MPWVVFNDKSRPWLITVQQPRRRPHLLGILQGQATVIIHSVSAEATYENIAGTLKGHHRCHWLMRTYQSQIKARAQLCSESLQASESAIKQLAHWALLSLKRLHLE